MTPTTYNTLSDLTCEDVLDLRELADLMDRLEGQDERDEDETEILAALKELESDMGDSLRRIGDDYEPTLIRESYFQSYAQELAEECDLIKRDVQWPYTCIDWEHAARELRYDYSTFTLGTQDYLIRSW